MTQTFHIPKPPLNYLPRPDQLEPLVALLLSDQPEAVGVVGVQGMGGIGKSVLAAAAAGEKRLQRRFKDGIYWLTVGQSPDLVALQRQLARDLGVPLNEIQFLDAALGRSELENRLAGKAVLLVLDDVWHLEHAEQLDVVRPPGRLLITTRDQSVLQGLGAAVHPVGLLSPDESLKLMAKWAGQKHQTLPPEAAEVARECGYLPPSGDQTLRVWDLDTGKTLATFTGESSMQCCAVAPDGVTIVAGEQSGRVHFLRLVEPPPGVRRKNKTPNRKPETGKAKRVKRPTRDQVFISYSHEDRVWLQRLQTHLKPYVRNATISVWDDTQIKTGTKWRDGIAAALAAARVGVLLVSPNFLASDFIAEKELPPLLAAAEKDGLTIVWVPISASAFEETPIADYQAAHDPGTPLDSLSDAAQNKAWVEICKKIKAAYAGT